MTGGTHDDPIAEKIEPASAVPPFSDTQMVEFAMRFMQ
jgi:hypothetical protein